MAKRPKPAHGPTVEASLPLFVPPKIGDRIMVRYGPPSRKHPPNVEFRTIASEVAVYNGRRAYRLDNGRKLDWFAEDGRLRTRGEARRVCVGTNVATWKLLVNRFDLALNKITSLGQHLPEHQFRALVEGLEGALAILSDPLSQEHRAEHRTT